MAKAIGDRSNRIWQDPNFGGAMTDINQKTGLRELLLESNYSTDWLGEQDGVGQMNPGPQYAFASEQPNWNKYYGEAPKSSSGGAFWDFMESPTPFLMAAGGIAAAGVGAGAGVAAEGAAGATGAFDAGGWAGTGLEGGMGLTEAGGAGSTLLEGGSGTDMLDAFDITDFSQDIVGSDGGMLGGSGTGTLMPAAVPESSAALTQMGLVQTSPGTWSLPAAAAASMPPGVGSAISRILNGTANADDYLKVGGTLGSTALGLLGANAKSDAQTNLATQFAEFGAPYRKNLADISADPNLFYNSPGAQGSLDAVLKRLSVGGNPANNPYKQSLAMGTMVDRYGAERDRLAGYGGLVNFNAAAPGALTNAANSGGDIYNVLGSGLADLTRAPQQGMTLQQLLAAMGASGSF